MKRHYLTAKRLEILASGLSQRDWAILADVGRLRLVSGAQLAELHFGRSESARRLARQALVRLVEARLLVRLGRRVGGVRAGSSGFVYGLDVAGQRLLHPNRRRWWPQGTLSELFTRHVLAVSQVYVELRAAERSNGFGLLRFDGEPACWRCFHGPGGGRVVLKPDAHVVTAIEGFEDHVFVEVDLATESVPRVGWKAKRYIDYFRSGREQVLSGVFPQVLWLVPDDHRREMVVDALARVDADHSDLFAVEALDRAVNAIAPLETSAPKTPEVGR